MSPRRVALAAAAGTAALLTYAVLVEPRWLQVRRRTIHIRRLPPAFEGLRIGLLTDLHAGGWTSFRLVRRAARLLMREAPDVIAITGDLLSDRRRDFTPVLRALDALRAPLGVWTVPGNHDHIAGIAAWHAGVLAHPVIENLTNRYVLLKRGDARLCLAGVDDFYRGRPEIKLPPPDRRELTILLAHTPDQAERARRADDAIDLIIGGHTHGGQVRIPFLGAPLSSSRNPDLYDEGLRRRPWTQVYTSRGVGTVHLPIRFLARPEIAVLELTARPRPLPR